MPSQQVWLYQGEKYNIKIIPIIMHIIYAILYISPKNMGQRFLYIPNNVTSSSKTRSNGHPKMPQMNHFECMNYKAKQVWTNRHNIPLTPRGVDGILWYFSCESCRWQLGMRDTGGAGIAQWLEQGLLFKRSLVWVAAAAAAVGEFSSPGSTLCADS